MAETVKTPLPPAEVVASAFPEQLVKRNGLTGVFRPYAQRQGKGRGDIIPRLAELRDEEGNVIDVSIENLDKVTTFLNKANTFNIVLRKINGVGAALFGDDAITPPDTGETLWEEWVKSMEAPVFNPYGEPLPVLVQRITELSQKLGVLLNGDLSELLTNPAKRAQLEALREELVATNEAKAKKEQQNALRKAAAEAKKNSGVSAPEPEAVTDGDTSGASE